jgi:glycosyltransferase involved in cell wall biosynthesis
LLDQITPLIITYNEAPNIRRALDKLLWAERIVVIDSGSTDETVEILRGYPQVEVIEHPFADFASQCNYGLRHVASPWVLSLDADYELSDKLVRELASLTPAEGAVGYRSRFVYRIYGRPLRGSLYPTRIILFRKDHAFYRNEGHAHHLVLDGDVLPLDGVIYHDDRKPLARWLISQQRYAREEAEYLLDRPPAALRGTDKIRLMGWPAPIGVFFYTLFVKGSLFDGWPGWYYALQRTTAEMLTALEILDRRWARSSAAGQCGSGEQTATCAGMNVPSGEVAVMTHSEPKRSFRRVYRIADFSGREIKVPVLETELVNGMKVHHPKDLSKTVNRVVFFVETHFPRIFQLAKRTAIKLVMR